MIITNEMIDDWLDHARRRGEIITAVGGIALVDVVDQKAEVPEGWKLDPMTDFYIPPDVTIFAR